MNLLEELKARCEACTRCELHKTRNKVVFGVGKSDAKIMFIGEAPGAREDETGLPFVGKSGQLLDSLLEPVKLSRNDDVFITSINKCRPPNNRDPSRVEAESCKEWLGAQIEIINPKIIVCLGKVAATHIIGKDFKITKDHGKWYDIDGKKVTALYHPAALLRDPGRKPETIADIEKIREMIDSM